MPIASIRAWTVGALRTATRHVRLGRPLPILTGLLRGARWIPDASVRSCWLGTFEAEEQAEFGRVVRTGMRVYDLGANVGYYTLLASRLVGPRGRVIAVEPLPRNLAYLHRHVALNRLANVDIVEAAVADRPGVGRFTETASASENRLGAEGTLKVPITTLTALAERFGPPDVIKIDVEGAEHLVLGGAKELLRGARPTILLSLHNDTARAVCAQIAGELGYAVAPLVGTLPVEANSEWLLTPPAPRKGVAPLPGRGAVPITS